MRASARADKCLFEHECYEFFRAAGIDTPEFQYFSIAQLAEITSFMRFGCEYVLKCHIPGCLHKTEIGGVRLGVTRENALTET